MRRLIQETDEYFIALNEAILCGLCEHCGDLWMCEMCHEFSLLKPILRRCLKKDK